MAPFVSPVLPNKPTCLLPRHDRLKFTARLSTGIVSHNRDGLVCRRMRFGRRDDADVRIYVQEVRAVHTAASDGGMRAAVRLPGMRRACPPGPPDRTSLPQHVGRRASGRRKVRAHHRRIARRGKIARSRMQLLRRPGFQDGETCQGESVSASLTDLAQARPSESPSSRPDFLGSNPWSGAKRRSFFAARLNLRCGCCDPSAVERADLR